MYTIDEVILSQVKLWVFIIISYKPNITQTVGILP